MGQPFSQAILHYYAIPVTTIHTVTLSTGIEGHGYWQFRQDQGVYCVPKSLFVLGSD